MSGMDEGVAISFSIANHATIVLTQTSSGLGQMQDVDDIKLGPLSQYRR